MMMMVDHEEKKKDCFMYSEEASKYPEEVWIRVCVACLCWMED
jgi:hypothetical protein